MEKPRILVLASPNQARDDPMHYGPSDEEFVRVGTMADCRLLLRTKRFDGVYIDLREGPMWEQVGHLFQAESLLDGLGEGVCLVDLQLHISWSNQTFQEWCKKDSLQDVSFYEALGSPQILGPDYSPFHTALAEGRTVHTRLHCTQLNRFLELLVTPVLEPGGKASHLICLTRDMTALMLEQQKLDALHKAGRELSGLDPDQLAEMSVEERVELLKLNIRQFTHDLLHYDVVEIRLLDRQTNRLEPLLEEGMLKEAAGRVLQATAEGNGVTGFVAATGKSYVCPDTATDPLYLEGSAGARSSLTVPLLYQDQVIGTFNVESPRLNAFGEDDLQFAEIFCREIASALHTLELLTAEKRTTASQSIEAIRREVALPVDDILAAATTVLDRYIGHDPEMGEKLKQILASARSIKQCIQRVGENLAPGVQSGPDGVPHPQLRGFRVLVADSDERVRRSAHSLLGNFSCVVETASNGKEALTMARLGTYDAILVDIRLPDITGHDAYCKLRAAQPQARVILMTAFGYDPSHAIVKCRQEGLRFVLYKPFRVDQLLDALEGPESAGSTNPASPPKLTSA